MRNLLSSLGSVLSIGGLELRAPTGLLCSVIALAFLVTATSAPATTLTITGNMSGTPTGIGFSSFAIVGTFTFTFDDSLVTGAAFEAFSSPLTSLALTPNPFGTTTFDLTNAEGWLIYNSGALTNTGIGGSGNPSGMAVGADDLRFWYRGTSAVTLSPFRLSAITTSDTGIGDDLNPTGSISVVPEPSTALLLASGLAVMGVRRRR